MKELGSTLLLSFFALSLILVVVFGNGGLKVENENLGDKSVQILKDAQTEMDNSSGGTSN